MKHVQVQECYSMKNKNRLMIDVKTQQLIN